MDFEARAGRALPSAPQARFRGLCLSLRERGRVLRLAVGHLQKLVVAGSLLPAQAQTRCGALVPLEGPQLCGLNRRPYFNRRKEMIHHVKEPQEYCEGRQTLRARPSCKRPYVHRPRRSATEVDQARVHRARHGHLSTALLPASAKSAPPPLMAKGGGGASFGGDLYPEPLGSSRPLLPFSLLRPQRGIRESNTREGGQQRRRSAPGKRPCREARSSAPQQTRPCEGGRRRPWPWMTSARRTASRRARTASA
jgi:hypothetical protein